MLEWAPGTCTGDYRSIVLTWKILEDTHQELDRLNRIMQTGTLWETPNRHDLSIAINAIPLWGKRILDIKAKKKMSSFPLRCNMAFCSWFARHLAQSFSMLLMPEEIHNSTKSGKFTSRICSSFAGRCYVDMICFCPQRVQLSQTVGLLAASPSAHTMQEGSAVGKLWPHQCQPCTPHEKGCMTGGYCN